MIEMKKGGRSWVFLANGWTIVYLAFVVLNFIKGNSYEFLVSPLSTLYIGVLSIYVGGKEFDRWHESYEGRRHGEIFVIVWTVVVVFLTIGGLILGEAYRLAPDIAATYIGVLTIFVLTQKSKRLYAKKHSR